MGGRTENMADAHMMSQIEKYCRELSPTPSTMPCTPLPSPYMQQVSGVPLLPPSPTRALLAPPDGLLPCLTLLSRIWVTLLSWVLLPSVCSDACNPLSTVSSNPLSTECAQNCLQ
jgi:hypothetical protein